MIERRSWLRRGWPVTAAALAMALATAGGAAGAVGDVSYRGCISDNDPPAEEDCSPRMDGLRSPNAVAISPDLRSAYVVGGDQALVVLDRNRRSGGLSFRQCFDDVNGGSEAACPPVPAMSEPEDVVVSPDGRSVYVAATNDEAISRFNRNLTTGALTYAGCVERVGAGAGCAQTAPAISLPFSLSISGDGRSLYAAAAQDHAVVRFNRNASTGALAFAQCIEDDDAGGDCPTTTPGLDGASDVEVSPDGRSVYAVGGGDGVVVRFNRVPATGAITPAQCLEDGPGSEPTCADITGLQSVERVEASADGRSVYALGYELARLDRNRATGVLTLGQCFEDLPGSDPVCQDVEDFNQNSDVALSPDDRSVYVASLSDDSVHHFSRDPRTGALAFARCFEDVDIADSSCADVEGLEGVEYLAVSGDGRSLYAAGRQDGAVAIFNRVPLRCRGRPGTIYGTPFKDALRGTRRADVFIGFGGRDRALGLGGRDVACGGAGADRLLGGRGADILLGGPGPDRLFGGRGRDRLLGGKGRDRLLGGPGRDRLRGGPGRDRQRQ